MRIASIKKHTVVLGCGISGLSVAHFLSKKTDDFIVLEKSGKTGGNIHSKVIDGYVVENGPNTVLLNNESIKSLIKEVGLWDKMSTPLKTAENNRYVLHQNKLQLLPRNPIEFIKSPLLKWHEKLRLLKEPFVKPHKGDTSLANFISKRFGKAILTQFVEPFVTGIYSGNPKKMSAKHTLKMVWEAEQKHGSVIKGLMKKEKTPKAQMFNFPKGLSELTDKISRILEDKIQCNTEITRISKTEDSYQIIDSENNTIYCQKIISTIPAHALSKIIDDFNIIAHLNAVEYVPVDVFHFGFDKKDVKNQAQGFGVLSKPSDNKHFLGILFNSRIFPHVSPKNKELFTVIVGGSRQSELCSLEKGELEKIILEELMELIQCQKAPSFKNHTSYIKGIPQYNLELDQLILEIGKFENNFPNFHILGNYFNGVSVSDCVKKSEELIENIHFNNN